MESRSFRWGYAAALGASRMLLSYGITKTICTCFWFFVDILAPQPVWHLQPVGCHQIPIAENLLGRSCADELALIQNDHAVAGVEDHFQIVRGDDLSDRQLVQ